MRERRREREHLVGHPPVDHDRTESGAPATMGAATSHSLSTFSTQPTAPQLRQDAASTSPAPASADMGQFMTMAATVQRKHADVAEPGLADEPRESAEMLGAFWQDFCLQAGEILLDRKAIEREKQNSLSAIFFRPPDLARHPQVQAFARAAAAQIDRQLPELLGGLPFTDAAAAIRFAQNLILVRLRADQQLATGDDPASAIGTFLSSSIEALPVSTAEGEDEEVESEANTVAKPDPKRHRAAEERVKKINPADRSYREHREAAVKENLDQQDRHLADLILLLPPPLLSDALADGNGADTHTFVQHELQQSRAGNETDPFHNVSCLKGLTRIAVKLPFASAVEVLTLLRKAPNLPEPSVHRLRVLLSQRYVRSSANLRSFAELLSTQGLLNEAGIDWFAQRDEVQNDRNWHATDPSARGAVATADSMLAAGDRHRQEADANDAGEKSADIKALGNAALAQLNALKTPRATLESLAEALRMELPAADADSSALATFGKGFMLQQFCTAIGLAETRVGGDSLLEAYEDVLALRKLAPGDQARSRFVALLQANNLLAGVDPEVLGQGAKSAASLIDDAIKGGWATKSEIDICSKLLGPRAFMGILGSHMARRKQGPLRSIIEQTMRHREATAHVPPMTNQSLALDTNMIDILLPAIKDVPAMYQHRRTQINQLIIERNITDIRLANMNVAELGDYGSLIGRTISIEVSDKERRSLNFLGVPYSKSRSNPTYTRVFKELEEKQVGENKGHADRSMMADLFLAEREDGHAPTFASADLGVGREIGTGESQFNPEKMRLPAMNIAVIETTPGERGESSGTTASEAAPAPSAAGATASEAAPSAKGPAKQPGDLGKGNGIYGFIVNGTHTVAEIAQMITAETYGEPAKNFQLFVVGGAVRDYARGVKTKDVDVKTNMPVETLTQLLDRHNLPYHATIKDNLLLVTVAQEPQSLDIVCSTKTRDEFDALYDAGGDDINLLKDAQERDFTLNALYMNAGKDSENGYMPARNEKDIIDPMQAGGLADARAGRMRFVADRDKRSDGPDGEAWAEVSPRERAERVVAHLIAHPEEFGRTLKFIERGHNQWMSQGEKPQTVGRRKNKHQIGPYHLDAEVLDILRANAKLILGPLLAEAEGDNSTLGDADTGVIRGEDIHRGASPSARKNYFLHKTGFKTPMELVSVMQRLQFPADAIQMIIPDTVAGQFATGDLAFNRNVAPRNRPTGTPGEWKPEEAPRVKADMTTGDLYQHRIYACLPDEAGQYQPNANDPSVNASLTKILIDVDFTNHAVSGHPAPHHHLFREIGGKWIKNESGFSNTGQPGHPDVRLEHGVYVYHGPTPWRWRPKREEGEDFASVLREACAQAGLPLREEGGGVVSIGDELRIPLARLQQIDAQDAGGNGQGKYRIQRLLMLIQTLQQGEVEKDDNSLRYFTQSKNGGERLRFERQLQQVDTFLLKTCGLRLGGDVLAGLAHADRLRLYDLIAAGYGERESAKAARYAMARLGSRFDAAPFVEYFEFYMASMANSVGEHEVAGLNEIMIARTSTILKADAGHALGVARGDDDTKLSAALVLHSQRLRFTSATAAAYHLHKHTEVTKVDPRQFSEGSDKIDEAANLYLEAVRKTVAAGRTEKIVHESDTSRVFFFKDGDVTAIIEAQLEGNSWSARVLSCYGKDGDPDMVVGAPLFDPTARPRDEDDAP